MRSVLLSFLFLALFGFTTADADNRMFERIKATDTLVQARYVVFMPDQGAELDLAAREVISLAARHANTVDATRVLILEDPDGMRALSGENPELRDRRTARVYEALVGSGLPSRTMIAIDRSGSGVLAIPDEARADNPDLAYVEIVVWRDRLTRNYTSYAR